MSRHGGESAPGAVARARGAGLVGLAAFVLYALTASPFVASEPAPLLPLPVPPAEPTREGIYLLGFLTGLGLSLMAGVALYLLIALG